MQISFLSLILQIGIPSISVVVGDGSNATVSQSLPFSLMLVRDGEDVGEEVSVAKASGPGSLSGATETVFTRTTSTITLTNLRLDVAGDHVLTATLTMLDGRSARVSHFITVSTVSI